MNLVQRKREETEDGALRDPQLMTSLDKEEFSPEYDQSKQTEKQAR